MYSSEERERSNKREIEGGKVQRMQKYLGFRDKLGFSLFHPRRSADVAGISPVAVPTLTCTDCGTVDPKVVRTQEQQLATN